MKGKRAGLLGAVMLWLCIAIVACGGEPTQSVRVAPSDTPAPTEPTTSIAPTPVPPAPTEPVPTLAPAPPEPTNSIAPTPVSPTPAEPMPTPATAPHTVRLTSEEPTTESVTIIPPTEEPSPTEDILDDLAKELFVSFGGIGGYCDDIPTGPLPAATGDVWESHSGWICLWGFPAGSAVSVEFYDPRGGFVTAREVTIDDEKEGVGLVEILVSFAGWPTGSWTIVAKSTGTSLESPFEVAEPDVPVITVVPNGPDLFASNGPLDWVEIPYVPGDQVAIFGAGFPAGRSLPLGIYYGDMYSEAAHLITAQEVQTDEQGRFEVNQPIEALALLGEGLYYAIVPLDSSYQPIAFGFDSLGALGGFVVPSVGAHAGDVILVLALDGGPLDDPTVQQAVLYALNRLHLSDYFGTPVTFLLSAQGHEPVDVTAEPWDPNRARQLLAEAGYPRDIGTEFVYPDDDERLASLASSMADNLASVGFSAELAPVSPADIDSYVSSMLAAGESVLQLVRR